MNKKGFTLIELLATLVILSIVVTIGGVAITKTISNSKKKNYDTVIANVKTAVETYYQECTYGGLGSCQNPVKASTLINYGYINSNYTAGGKYLIDPRTEGKNNNEIVKICTVSYVWNDTTNKLSVTVNTKTGINASGC